MILLALDTSEKSQSLALIQDDHLLAQRHASQPSSHGEELLSHLESLFQDSALGLDQVDAIALTIGPGSFTGLRIAVSTVKGLAVAKNIPVIPVGTLQALAAPYLADHPWVAPCLDARMGQVYGAVYSQGDAEGLPKEVQAPAPMEINEFSRNISALSPGGIVVGSGLATYPALGKGAKTDPKAVVQAPWVARIAAVLYKDGKVLAGHELQPTYLRLSTPELRLLERTGVSAKKP